MCACAIVWRAYVRVVLQCLSVRVACSLQPTAFACLAGLLVVRVCVCCVLVHVRVFVCVCVYFRHFRDDTACRTATNNVWVYVCVCAFGSHVLMYLLARVGACCIFCMLGASQQQQLPPYWRADFLRGIRARSWIISGVISRLRRGISRVVVVKWLVTPCQPLSKQLPDLYPDRADS